jgi:hypothetical protein
MTPKLRDWTYHRTPMCIDCRLFADLALRTDNTSALLGRPVKNGCRFHPTVSNDSVLTTYAYGP